MNRDGSAAALNAHANASRIHVGGTDALRILSTGDGPGHLVRAPFEDCPLEVLDRLAAAHGLSRAALRAAYAEARRRHGAFKPDFEEA